MRTPLVIGNWKCNGSRAWVREFVPACRGALDGVSGVEIGVCPPAAYLADTAAALVGSAIALGAQDVGVAGAGAHTGEHSAAMLKDFACRYVIVGHSERRADQHEDDAAVARKCAAALAAGLVPVVCVGERLDQREAGQTTQVVTRQLDAVLAQVGVPALAHAVVAYEPVWAIGTGRTATPAQAQEVHGLIRHRLGAAAATVRILYGGSVKPDNAPALFAQADVDGGLIGGASLEVEQFAAICRAAVQA